MKDGAQDLVIIKYFNNLFMSSRIQPNSMVLRDVGLTITEVMNEELTENFIDEKIVHVVNQMHLTKASRLMACHPFFYQKYQLIVGKHICAAIKRTLSSGMFPPL